MLDRDARVIAEVEHHIDALEQEEEPQEAEDLRCMKTTGSKYIKLRPNQKLVITVVEKPKFPKVKQFHGNYELYYDKKLDRLQIRKLVMTNMWR
jgi:hypothetical protein